MTTTAGSICHRERNVVTPEVELRFHLDALQQINSACFTTGANAKFVKHLSSLPENGFSHTPHTRDGVCLSPDLRRRRPDGHCVLEANNDDPPIFPCAQWSRSGTGNHFPQLTSNWWNQSIVTPWGPESASGGRPSAQSVGGGGQHLFARAIFEPFGLAKSAACRNRCRSMAERARQFFHKCGSRQVST